MELLQELSQHGLTSLMTDSREIALFLLVGLGCCYSLLLTLQLADGSQAQPLLPAGTRTDWLARTWRALIFLPPLLAPLLTLWVIHSSSSGVQRLKETLSAGVS